MKFKTYINEQNNIKILIVKPSQCTKEEKETFINLVTSGGQNVVSHVKSSFKKLIWVGLLYEDGDIKAVSSLKPQNKEIFINANVEDEMNKYPYEIGFSFTDPDSRGKGFNKKLKEKLFGKVGNKGIYATIRIDNKASISVNTKLGFKKLGKPWKGIVTDVQLWVLG